MELLLSIDDVIQIHDQILQTEAGLKGYYGDHRLAGALYRVDTLIRYSDKELDIFDIACMYFEAISKGHCFADANKRTAFTVASTYLKWHSVKLKDDPDFAYALADFVAGLITKEQLIDLFVYLVDDDM